jgi:putative transposase
MSRKYKFNDSQKPYFVSFAVVDWVDLFTRNVYRDILVDSLRYCQKEKDLELYAWCIMLSHVHLIISSKTSDLSDIMRDMKGFYI